MPWPLVSEPETAGGARDVEAAMVVDAGSATVEVARRINGSRNSSRSSSSISRSISKSSPRISNGTRNFSDRDRNISTNGIIRDIRHSGLHSVQGGGVHHVLVSGVVSTGVFF